MTGQEILRVGLSLPCMVPVRPGTPDATGQVGTERTETCRVDAWWVVGRAMMCSHHLREVLGGERFDEIVSGLESGHVVTLHPRETLPWGEQHRYGPGHLPEWHPLASIENVSEEVR